MRKGGHNRVTQMLGICDLKACWVHICIPLMFLNMFEFIFAECRQTSSELTKKIIFENLDFFGDFLFLFFDCKPF